MKKVLLLLLCCISSIAATDNLKEIELNSMTDWGHGIDINDGAAVCGWDNLDAQEQLEKVYRAQGVSGDYGHIFCY